MKQKTFNIKSTNARDKKSQNIVLEGDLGFRNASGVLEALKSTAIGGEKVLLHLKNVEKFDVTTIQIIKAFEKHLAKKNVQSGIIAELPDDTARLLGNTGFSSIF